MLEVINKNEGICAILWANRFRLKLSNEERLKLEEEMHRFLKAKGWHSGRDISPIKHPWLPSGYAYYICDLWEEATEYGRRRRATLAHLNKYLEELHS